MVMKSVRIVFAVLYSVAFVLFLTRCSANVSSVDKATLRAALETTNSPASSPASGINAGVNVSSVSSDVKTNFLDSSELQDLKWSEDETVLMLKGDAEDSSDRDILETFRKLRENGSTVVSTDGSVKGKPIQAYFVLSQNSLSQIDTLKGCTLEVRPGKKEGSWKLGLRDTPDCVARRALLENVEEVLVLFRSNTYYP